MREEIKNIILEYCEGISHLEFDADKLDEIAERIEELSKLHQPTVIGTLPACKSCGKGTSFDINYNCFYCGKSFSGNVL